jgi:hypothetical protein
MPKKSRGANSTGTDLVYLSIRNATSPDELSNGAASYFANVNALEVLKLNTDENLRQYLAEYNPRKRNSVHRAIESTIVDEPSRFIQYNSGLTVSATAVDIDDKKKIVRIFDGSIINGGQTQGEIRRWATEQFGEEIPIDVESPFSVRVEIMVEPDPTVRTETAIARNSMTTVRDLSIISGRGHLEELYDSVFKATGRKIQMSESDSDPEFLDTRRIIQLARLMMPESVSQNDSAAERLRAYKNPAQCLSEFSIWHEQKGKDEAAKRKYDFTIQMAPIAFAEYERWERHPAWNGLRLREVTQQSGGRRAFRRDPSADKIIWVAPGILFPIIGSMSEFVEEHDGEWELVIPEVFEDQEMINLAAKQFRSLQTDPMQMGRTIGAYDALRTYPHTVVTVLRNVKAITPA